jgi:hypothetical protein
MKSGVNSNNKKRGLLPSSLETTETNLSRVSFPLGGLLEAPSFAAFIAASIKRVNKSIAYPLRFVKCVPACRLLTTICTMKSATLSNMDDRAD